MGTLAGLFVASCLALVACGDTTTSEQARDVPGTGTGVVCVQVDDTGRVEDITGVLRAGGADSGDQPYACAE
jgi:hypothetical protein